MRAILDTSVLIAVEQRRELDLASLPDELAVSVVTLAELELGVHAATDVHTRAQRLATLTSTRETYVALPVDATVASHYAELMMTSRASGKSIAVQDAWIAATAIAHDAAIATQDADYDDIPLIDVIRV